MLKCPYCGHQEWVGALFCQQCGYPLWEEVARTEAQRSSAVNGKPAVSAQARKVATNRVVLRLPNGQTVPLQGSGPWLVGRPAAGRQPDVDAQALGARHVSRQHARLEWRRGGLYLVDLGSTNGTWINGRRLTPHEPKRLHDGDWVRWADLEAQVLFDVPYTQMSSPSPEELSV